MKTTAALGNATRAVGKLFFALVLLLLAAVLGFGGTALFVYHQFGDARRPVAQLAGGTRTVSSSVAHAKRAAADPTPVAADRRTNQPQYLFVGNTGGQGTAPVRPSPTTNVPAPLANLAQSFDVPAESARLNDPESHYILDPRTGRVVGIDGSAGARREEEQDKVVELSQPPRAIAVPTPEVRVASAVMADGQPVYDGSAAPRVNVAGAQYMPVRKALPVSPDDADVAPRNFNVNAYLSDDDRPVVRAQAVVPAGARVVKTLRVYRLPDGSQTVAAD